MTYYMLKCNEIISYRVKYIEVCCESPIRIRKRFINSPDILASFSPDFPQVNPHQSPQVDVHDDIDRSTLNVVTGDGRSNGDKQGHY